MAFVNGVNDEIIDTSIVGAAYAEYDEDTIRLSNRWHSGSFEVEDIFNSGVIFFTYDSENDSYNILDIENFLDVTQNISQVRALTGRTYLHYNGVSLPAGNILSIIPAPMDLDFAYDNIWDNVYLIRAWIKGKISEEDTLYINPFIKVNEFTPLNENTKELAKHTGIVLTGVEFSEWTEVHAIVPLSLYDQQIDISNIGYDLYNSGIQLIRPDASIEYSDFFIDGVSFINLFPFYEKKRASIANEEYVEANILPYLPAWFKVQYYFSISKVESLRVKIAKIIPNPASINSEVKLQAEIEDIDYLIKYDPMFCGESICGVEHYYGSDLAQEITP